MSCKKILLTSMFFGLVLGGCSSEESKLEAEIINKDAFLEIKTNCELTEKVMVEKLGISGGSIEDCVGTVFDKRIKEVCKKKGFEFLGTTCVNVTKRVKTRVADYLAEKPPK